MGDFNPRTPCGVRPGARKAGRARLEFQSTHPVRGATADEAMHFEMLRDFNPRTPCGVRHDWQDAQRPGGNFNPRTPCGVRPGITAIICLNFRFQSTHPVRGATMRRTLRTTPKCLFQSTHPVRGATLIRTRSHRRSANFNPRTPCGVRRRRRRTVCCAW